MLLTILLGISSSSIASTSTSIADLHDAKLTERKSLLDGRLLISLPPDFIADDKRFAENKNLLRLTRGKESITIIVENQLRVVPRERDFVLAVKDLYKLIGGRQPICGIPAKTAGGVRFVPLDFVHSQLHPLRSLREAYLALPGGCALHFQLFATHYGNNWNEVEELVSRIFDSLSPGPHRGFESTTVSIEDSGIKLSMAVRKGWWTSHMHVTPEFKFISSPAHMHAGIAPEVGSAEDVSIEVGFSNKKTALGTDSNQKLSGESKRVQLPVAVLGQRVDWQDDHERHRCCKRLATCSHYHYKCTIPIPEHDNIFVVVKLNATNKKGFSEVLKVLKSLQFTNALQSQEKNKQITK
ncbi:MAG: hypothetical protein K2W82_04880 [Candidatus Obscuribacterales bacterium]|nr:hypothetical protein [Candidatus Obscuribacterales bacterium]